MAYTSRVILLGLILCALAACSGSSDRAEKGLSKVFVAATGPLDDLNLRRTEIPPTLQELAIYPYLPPKKIQCKAIKAELAELDEMLGPDVVRKEVEVASNDASMTDVELPTAEKVADTGEDMAGDAIMGVVRSQTNFLPFRSIIRRLSGTDSHRKELEAAYQAGKLRRAYLKGLAESKFGKRCLQPKPEKAPAIQAKAQIASQG